MNDEKVYIPMEHRIFGHDGETWKSVIGYEGVYEVSNMGRVARILKSGDAKVLNASDSSGIGRIVNLCAAGKSRKLSVSTIVAMAFLNAKVTQHLRRIDGDVLNDRVDNLEPVRRKSGCKNQDPGKKIKGVWPERRNGVILRWVAQFKDRIEHFTNRQEAVRQRDRWQREFTEECKRRYKGGT
jgi:hypothetical protein